MRSSSTLSSWSSTIRIRGDASAAGEASGGIAAAEEALDLGNDRARLARLGQVPIAADLHRLLAIGSEGVSCQGDDGDVLGGGVVLEDLGRLPTVDDRD